MKKLHLTLSLVCCLWLSRHAIADESAGDAAASLTAAQKTLAARGGEEAWQKIQTMAWIGHVESGGATARTLPFLLEMKRPNKTRFEVVSVNQKSVRIYNGREGWKVKPGTSGKISVENYTAEEIKFARDAQVIDGPLMDYIQRGIGWPQDLSAGRGADGRTEPTCVGRWRDLPGGEVRPRYAERNWGGGSGAGVPAQLSEFRRIADAYRHRGGSCRGASRRRSHGQNGD
jgi:hypothetical protein